MFGLGVEVDLIMYANKALRSLKHCVGSLVENLKLFEGK
jgi:hypothetical protein